MQARERMIERLRGVPDALGGRLSSRLARPSGRVRPLIGKVADSLPLSRSEEALAASAPAEILRGLGAISLALGGAPMVLAIRADYGPALQVFSHLARSTKVDVVTIPARYPLCDESVATLVAQVKGLPQGALETSHIYDAVVLRDAGCAMTGARLAARPVSVVGSVGDPGVYELPVGALMEDVVSAAGGALCDAWTVLEGGGETQRWLDKEGRVDLHTRVLTVLPNAHPRALAARAPLGEVLRRVAAACTGCGLCSEVCPVEGCLPHEMMRAVKVGFGGDAEVHVRRSGVEACDACGLCSLACPASVDPARICHEVRDRAGGRRAKTAVGRGGWPMAAVEPRFGRAPRDARLWPFRSERLAIPLIGERGAAREALVGVGDLVEHGSLIARGAEGFVDLFAQVAGEVEDVDADLGLILRCV